MNCRDIFGQIFRRLTAATPLVIAFSILPLTVWGQSDPASFATIVELPPTTYGPFDSVGSDTQVNVRQGQLPFAFNAGAPDGSSSNVEINLDGGSAGRRFRANTGSTINVLNGSTIDTQASAEQGSTVNLIDGVIRRDFTTAGEVNVSGGAIGIFFRAQQGSVVNLSGGSIGMVESPGLTVSSFLQVQAGATVVASGGTITDGFEALQGSNVSFVGNEFVLNGVPQTAPGTIDVLGNDVLTGTFQDGTSFVFSGQNRNRLNAISLDFSAVPVASTAPILIASAQDEAPSGLRSGQSLTLTGDGTLPNFFSAVDSELNINGGTTGTLRAAGTEINLTSGMIGERSNINDGTVLNITDGIVDSHLAVNRGAVVNISGGEIGFDPDVGTGGTLNISGGQIGSQLFAAEGSVVNLTGGEIGSSLSTALGSIINISDGTLGDNASGAGTFNISGGNLGDRFSNRGGTTLLTGGRVGAENEFLTGATIRGSDFRLNGRPVVATDAFSVGSNSILTGVLTDGSSFTLSPRRGDTVNQIRLEEALTPAPSEEIFLVNGLEERPRNLQATEQLVLSSGGDLGDNFSGVGAAILISGGTVGENFEVYDSNVRLVDGTIGIDAAAHGASTIEMTGGRIGRSFWIYDDSVINVSGGSLGDESSGSASLFLSGDSRANISGGTHQGGLSVSERAVASVTGGTLDRMSVVDGGRAIFTGGTARDVSLLRGGSVEFSNDIVVERVSASGSEVVINDGRFDSIQIASSTLLLFGGRVDNALVRGGSTFELEGGSIDQYLHLEGGATLNVHGTEFFLDGSPLDFLMLEEAFEIADRQVTLSGTLLDGSLFSFDLDALGSTNSQTDFFSAASSVTVTLQASAIPEPCFAGLLGLVTLGFVGRRRRGK